MIRKSCPVVLGFKEAQSYDYNVVAFQTLFLFRNNQDWTNVLSPIKIHSPGRERVRIAQRLDCTYNTMNQVIVKISALY